MKFSSILQLSTFNGNWCFSWHVLSEIRSLPASISWLRFSDLLRRFFLSIKIFHFFFLDLNFTITVSFFSRRWYAWRSFGITSWPAVRSFGNIIFQFPVANWFMVRGYFYRFASMMFALFTAFLSSCMIRSLKKRLHFFEIASSEDRISNLQEKLSNEVVRFGCWDLFNAHKFINYFILWKVF